ncbi:MAG: hypothetical protein IT360_20100 [Gemmatimonadaceae bacterium]|nr:hypothetical protein [Gemmatimonadaceae bacterium]
MKRTVVQQVSLVAAALLGLAPLSMGLLRQWSTGGDGRILWMAVVTSLFTAGVLAAAIGRRRTRRAVVRQAVIILIVATLLALGTAYLLESTAGPGDWAMSLLLGGCMAGASVLVAYSRPGAQP